MEPETTQQPNTGDSDKGSMGPLIGSIIIIITPTVILIIETIRKPATFEEIVFFIKKLII
jgi:hypothetical protein